MAQLAGSDMTRQTIYLVETGKVRPSSRTLDIIATRTSRPAAYFLKGRVDAGAAPLPSPTEIDDLQVLCVQQKFDKAIEIGLRILEQSPEPRLEAYARQYVGQALVRSSKPDEGLDHLRRAQLILESATDPWLEVECADWEACALYLKEDRRALAVAERALKLCRSTQPHVPGTEARILEHIATIHVKNHSYEKAIASYEDALEVAGSVRDLSRLGRTYHGLSAAYQQRGDISRAIEFTHKALALYALEDDTALLARGENELGLLLMRQGQMDRAEEAFRTALAHFEQSGTNLAKSHVLLSLGELQMKTGRLREAAATIRQAMDLAIGLGERLAQSTAHELMGQLYERMGKHRLADRELKAAIKLLRSQGLVERLAESHATYADVLDARGNSVSASVHWKQAAHLALRGDVAPPKRNRAV